MHMHKKITQKYKEQLHPPREGIALLLMMDRWNFAILKMVKNGCFMFENKYVRKHMGNRISRPLQL